MQKCAIKHAGASRLDAGELRIRIRTLEVSIGALDHAEAHLPGLHHIY